MITPISFRGCINSSDQKDTRQKPKLCQGECDCFIKTKGVRTPIQSESDNDFIIWAGENDFLKNGINRALSEENLLGSGFENAVYEIPNNDEYVLRVSKSYPIGSGVDFGEYEIIDTEDKALKSNFGQETAVIKSKNPAQRPVSVLKKQNGISNGNPPATVIYDESGKLMGAEIPYEAIARKEHYANCIKFLAELPQEKYDDLIDKILELDEAGYKFDYYNPNNFLLDTDKKSIEIIDVEKMSEEYKNNFGDILWALANIGYLNTYISDYTEAGDEEISRDEKYNAIENTALILEKYTKALQNKGEKYSMDGYEFVCFTLGSLPMSIFLRTFDNEEKIAKLKAMGVLN